MNHPSAEEGQTEGHIDSLVVSAISKSIANLVYAARLYGVVWSARRRFRGR